MKRPLIIVSLALAAVLGAAKISRAQDRVHVAISNFSASYISMHIARKRGFYAEEGMTVQVILMAGLTSTRALIGNSVEFGSARNPTAAVQGAKLKILMVFNDKPPGGFMAQPGFKSVGELRGKPPSSPPTRLARHKPAGAVHRALFIGSSRLPDML